MAVRNDEYLRLRECDDRIDRGDSVAHVTLPAFDLNKVREKKNKQIVRIYLNDSIKNRKFKSTQFNASDPIATNYLDKKVLRDADSEEVRCEFSEQSNVEDFGPLPESVFEAIEDSQECDEVGHNFNGNEPATNENVAIVEVKGHRHPSLDAAASTNRTDAKSNKTRKCPKCDKTYAASSSYFYHLKYSHNQTKEHECEVCGKKFGTRASLSAHGSIHTGDRRHACKQCEKRFRTAAGLYIHEQTHSGIKNHSCSSCERSFRWRTHLQRHERRHRGERPHACPQCARAFSVRADLLRHARTHAAGVHACDRCGDTFAQPRYLRVHVLNKHPDASPARNDRK